MANRMSMYSLASDGASRPAGQQSSQVSTTTLLNTVHNIYLSSCHEDPTSTALREAEEEAGIDPAAIEPTALWIDDHGGWSYVTVLARPARAIRPDAMNAESAEIRWCDNDEIDSLPLHDGLAATWPHVRDAPPRLVVVVDDRADPRFAVSVATDPDSRHRVEPLIRHGVRAAALPPLIDAKQVTVLLPRVITISATEPVPIWDVEEHREWNDPYWGTATGWWRRGYGIVAAADGTLAAAQQAVVGLAGDGSPATQIVVVTDDAAIRAAFADWTGAGPAGSAIAVVAPDWLVPLLDGRGGVSRTQ